MRSIFGSMRGHWLDSEAAHAAALGSRQGSAPPVLQDAEGFVPRTALQDLRLQAFSRSAAASCLEAQQRVFIPRVCRQSCGVRSLIGWRICEVLIQATACLQSCKQQGLGHRKGECDVGG